MAGVISSTKMGTHSTCGRSFKSRRTRIPMTTNKKADPVPINEPSCFVQWGIQRKHLNERKL
jgi:hypothetical protein